MVEILAAAVVLAFLKMTLLNC